MSIHCMNWVWQNSPAGGMDRLVLLALADEANDHGGSCHPSIRTLAHKTRSHTATVVDAVHRLETQGCVVVVRPETKGRGRFNHYHILMGEPVDNPSHECAESRPFDSEECADHPPEMRGSTRADPVVTDPPQQTASSQRTEVVQKLTAMVVERHKPSQPEAYKRTVRAGILRRQSEAINELLTKGSTVAEIVERLAVIEVTPVTKASQSRDAGDELVGASLAIMQQNAERLSRDEADLPDERTPVPAGLRDRMKGSRSDG